MATNNSSNQIYTNNADGWDLSGGTTPRKLTTTGADVTLTGSGTAVYTFPASTSTLASQTLAETFTNKTLTSPIISSSVSSTLGSIERDVSAFYSTPVSGARGVSPSTMYSIVASGGFALSTASGVQSCFASTGDVWTLAGSTTYIMEGHYAIQQATNNVTVALAFALGGSVTSIRYIAFEVDKADNTVGASPLAITEIAQVASTVVTIASTTNKNIYFKGLIRTNAGGTVTPQINFSGTAAGTPTMLAGSYIMFTPIGTNTNNILGAVA